MIIWNFNIGGYIYPHIASPTLFIIAMAYLKSKSELNRAAADSLYKSGQHPSAVHCAYYSCVQLMKHIIIHKVGKSEQQIEAEYRQVDTSGKRIYGGIHEYLINILYNILLANNKDASKFNSNVTQLKKLRGKSDYSDTFSVDSGISSTSIKLSDIVIKELKTNFSV
jgi:hypothetical protein